MISKGAEFSEYLKQNYKCKPQDLLRRKLKYVVGLNDSDYLTQPSIGGVLEYDAQLIVLGVK